MLWQPWKVTLLGIVIWLAVWVFAPIEGITPLSSTAIVYIIVCYLGLLSGCLLPTFKRMRPPSKRQAHSLNLKTLHTLFWPTFFAGLLGVFLRYFDRVILRGASLDLDVAEARELLAQESTSALGVLGAFFTPFAFLPLIIILMSKGVSLRSRKALYAALLYTLPVIDAARYGSRTVMLVAFGLAIFVFASARMKGALFNLRFTLFGFLTFVIFAVLSTSIFNYRLESQGRDLSEVSITSVFAQSIGPDDEAKIGLFSRSDSERLYYHTIIPNSLYYTSGIYEFSRLWSRPDEQSFTYGTYFMQPYIRVIISILGIQNTSNFLQPNENAFYRRGVFSSLFGHIWVEFGYFGPFVLMFLGLMSAKMSKSVRSGDLFQMPLYALLLVAFLLAPVVSIFQVGPGFFSLNAFLLFALIGQTYNKRHRNSLIRY